MTCERKQLAQACTFTYKASMPTPTPTHNETYAGAAISA